MKVIAFFNPEDYSDKSITGILIYESQELENQKKATLEYYNSVGNKMRGYKKGMTKVVEAATRYCQENNLLLWTF